jgi:hypothetical protein
MPAPTIIFQDSIQTLPLGGPQTVGPGWGGGGNIFAGNSGPGFPVPSGGPYGLKWFDGRVSQVDSPFLSTPVLSTSLFFSFRCGSGASFTSVQYFVQDSLGHNLICFVLAGEADGSVSAYCNSGGSQRIFNSGKTGEVYLYRDEWYYFQVNVIFSTVGANVGVDCEVAIQGQSVGAGSAVSSSLASNGVGMQSFSIFEGATGECGMCNIALCDWVPLCLTNPSDYITQPTVGPPNTTPTAIIPQMLIEIAKLQSTEHALIHQALVEVAKLPSTANVKVHHMVIELALQGYFGGIFPEYVKRKNIGI